MFPFDLEDEEVEVIENEEKPYKEYEIDYTTGQLTGRIVEGLEAVKVWIYLALNTDRYNYQQYTWDYGHELSTLIGTTTDAEYITMEAKRLVEECLYQNEHITDITDFVATIENDKLSMKFTVETDYGEVEMSV